MFTGNIALEFVSVINILSSFTIRNILHSFKFVGIENRVAPYS